MAEEISDDRFKGEMIRMMETVILKLGEHDQKFDGLEHKFDGLEHKVDKITEEVISLKKNVRILSGQFTDVVGVVLQDNKRITKLEKDVEDLQSNIH